MAIKRSDSISTIDNRGTNTIEEAIKAIQDGKFVVVMDNEDRENEGDLIMAAQYATEESVAFMLRHSTGIICVPALPDRHDTLRLPLMVQENTEVHQCKFTITVDLKEGNTTGVSAADRARTIRALANPKITNPKAFNRPGHIFPLVAKEGGVLERAGHTEASIDLCRLAGCEPVGYICEMNDTNGVMMRRPDLEIFAKKHNLPLITISDLIRYRSQHETLVETVKTSTVHKLPTGSQVELKQYRSLLSDNGDIYEAMVFGTIQQNQYDTTVYIAESSASLLSTIHLQYAQKQILESSNGNGVILSMTSASNHSVSGDLMAQQSQFAMAVQVLKQLKITSIRLLVSPGAPRFNFHGFGVTISDICELSC